MENKYLGQHYLYEMLLFQHSVGKSFKNKIYTILYISIPNRIGLMIAFVYTAIFWIIKLKKNNRTESSVSTDCSKIVGILYHEPLITCLTQDSIKNWHVYDNSAASTRRGICRASLQWPNVIYLFLWTFWKSKIIK